MNPIDGRGLENRIKIYAHPTFPFLMSDPIPNALVLLHPQSLSYRISYVMQQRPVIAEKPKINISSIACINESNAKKSNKGPRI